MRRGPIVVVVVLAGSLLGVGLGGAAADAGDPSPDARVVDGCVIVSDADCAGVDLSGADLTGVDLSGANLMGARLVGTNLTGANLDHADLARAEGVRLSV